MRSNEIAVQDCDSADQQNPNCLTDFGTHIFTTTFHLLDYKVNVFFGQVQPVNSMQSKHISKNSGN
jgi:hypothetical protein